jgi:hypothetical protein
VKVLKDTIQQLQHLTLSIFFIPKQLLLMQNDVMVSADSLANFPLPKIFRTIFNLEPFTSNLAVKI